MPLINDVMPVVPPLTEEDFSGVPDAPQDVIDEFREDLDEYIQEYTSQLQQEMTR